MVKGLFPKMFDKNRGKGSTAGDTSRCQLFTRRLILMSENAEKKIESHPHFMYIFIILQKMNTLPLKQRIWGIERNALERAQAFAASGALYINSYKELNKTI